MKYLIRILITLFLSKNLHGQEIYGEILSPHIDGRGSDLYSEANKTILDANILPKSKLRIAETHALRRKTMLLAEANRRLFFNIKDTRRMARRASSLNNREQLLADAWASSATGKRDGRPWSDLFDDEKRDYRDRYFRAMGVSLNADWSVGGNLTAMPPTVRAMEMTARSTEPPSPPTAMERQTGHTALME
jgi:hypothetical protein